MAMAPTLMGYLHTNGNLGPNGHNAQLQFVKRSFLRVHFVEKGSKNMWFPIDVQYDSYAYLQSCSDKVLKATEM